jgi:serine/threonine protein kinase
MDIIETDSGNYRVAGKLKGGKSGDLILRVIPLKKKKEHYYILKASLNSASMEKEIHNTQNVAKLFKTRNNPIVKIRDAGQMRFKERKYYFYLMDDLSTSARLLRDIILDYCKSPKDDFLKSVFMNLFDVIAVLKRNSWSHCDLHTENIFVQTNGNIKIIDLNWASQSTCMKARKVTSTIVRDYLKCKGSLSAVKLYLDLLAQEVKKLNVDSDLSMFISILSILYLNNDNVKLFLYLEHLSKEINQTQHTSKKLDKFLNHFKLVLGLILEQ